jgi:hypothetical protein
MKILICALLCAFGNAVSFAQLSRDDIKEILLIQGNPLSKNLDAAADELYEKYTGETSFRKEDLATGVEYSIASGLFMGFHQSKTANYESTEWLPLFLRKWYGIKPRTDEVLGKSASWQKIWREADYTTDRMAYTQWERYYGGSWYYSVLTHWLVKNTVASLIRHRMKYGTFY